MGGAGHIWVEARREGTKSVLLVRDDGPGIPSEFKGRIFEALFTTKAKGNGLGLALCRRIAEAHAGTVTLEPSEVGATFTISIPDQPAAPVA
jgi:signal transduction histidine kinase